MAITIRHGHDRRHFRPAGIASWLICDHGFQRRYTFACQAISIPVWPRSSGYLKRAHGGSWPRMRHRRQRPGRNVAEYNRHARLGDDPAFGAERRPSIAAQATRTTSRIPASPDQKKRRSSIKVLPGSWHLRRTEDRCHGTRRGSQWQSHRRPVCGGQRSGERDGGHYPSADQPGSA